MYCGDETGAYIGDIGAHSSRFGYGGEDNPKYVVPSYVAQRSRGDVYIPSSCLKHHEGLRPVFRLANNGQQQQQQQQQPLVDPVSFLQQGDVIEDWDAYEHLWQSSFDVLRVRERLKHTSGGGAAPQKKKMKGLNGSTVRSGAPEDARCVHPLLAVDPGCGAGDRQLQKQTEILMESLQAEAVFVAPAPMLAAFAYGRQTCVVVDVGASGSRVTPVVDGLLLQHAQRRNGRGGDWLGHIAWKALSQRPTTPRYALRTPAKEGTLFHRWAMQELMYELRTFEHVTLDAWRSQDYREPFLSVGDSAMRVDVPSSDSSSSSLPHSFELPDGTTIDMGETRLGKDLCRIPELLFTNTTPFLPSSQKKVHSVLSQHATLSDLPLHKLVHESLTLVGDADLRKELCANIVLVGGSSLLPNMEQRLSHEMSSIVTGSFKCRVLASRHTVERSCASWIGASVLTSLGSFQQLWLSRAEYEEYGSALAIQRFP